jgi:hypothetical protein
MEVLSMKRMFACVVAAAALASPAFAQDSTQTEKYIELIRSDLKTQHTAIVTEVLDLDDTQSAAFWPIYREYDLKMSMLNDERITLIKDFATQYGAITDPAAKDLMKRAFKLHDQRMDLLEQYAGKVEKSLGGRVAARWAQVENALLALVDVQVASELPLLK